MKLRTLLLLGIMISAIMIAAGCGPAAPAPTEIRQFDSVCEWKSLGWDELSTAEQVTWGGLGWNAANWDGDAAPPESNDLAWADLNDSQRSAATQLGFDEASWTGFNEPGCEA